jgi:hypothetical protein
MAALIDVARFPKIVALIVSEPPKDSKSDHPRQQADGEPFIIPWIAFDMELLLG